LQTGLDSIVDTVVVNQGLIADLESGIDSTMDSVVVNQGLIANLETEVDSLKYHYGEAGDTLSPGRAYYLKSDDRWYRADTSTSIVARGFAVDSVNKGATGRFQKTGLLTISWYNFPTAGLKIVSDSVTAGGVSLTDSLRSNTKKMQNYGWTTEDSTTIDIEIDPHPWLWED